MKTVLFPCLSQQKNLVVAMSTREDGSMKLSQIPQAEIIKNREKFFQKNSISPQHVVSADIVHGENVSIVDPKDLGKRIPQTDALLTNEKQVYLSISTADCLPIFVFDPEKQVIGLIHAGWRGLEKRVIQETINSLTQNFDCNPQSLLVGIGPGIGPCHFAVQQDVLDVFQEYTNVMQQREGTYFLDLKNIAAQQLIQAGCLKEHIEINPQCTYCERDTYFSHRRDHVTPIQTMLSIIGIL